MKAKSFLISRAELPGKSLYELGPFEFPYLTGPLLFGNQVATINPSFIKYPCTLCNAVFSEMSISTKSPS